MQLVGNEHRALLDGITVACIGPITAETAKKAGLTVDICAEQYTINGLVEAIVAHQGK